MAFEIKHGDCLEVMRGMADNSVDAIVTDPPYGLSFMGKKWDYDVPSVEVWEECLRVLKPGGHLLAFAGTRTQHRMAVRIEDAGFEIRDMIAWVYGSGFPKSLDVSKAIDKAAGAEPIDLGQSPNWRESKRDNGQSMGSVPNEARITAPATDAARKWQGWGTALKPSYEPVTVARKPLVGTVAENVLAHGTGALNIDGCRVEASEGRPLILSRSEDSTGILGNGLNGSSHGGTTTQGRWPANLIHDGSDEVVGCFPETSGGNGKPRVRDGGGSELGQSGGWNAHENKPSESQQYADTGSAARFFKCCKFTKDDHEWHHQLNNGQAANNAERLCGSCETPTAQGLAETPISASKSEASQATQVCTGNCVSCTQSPSHANDAEQTGSTGTTQTTPSHSTSCGYAPHAIEGNISQERKAVEGVELDRGGAMRFLYNAKASKKDRDEGLEHLPEVARSSEFGQLHPGTSESGNTTGNYLPRRNHHPTVKPTDLMRYLCRLVTPPGGTVLDPFTGSGSTGKAAVLEGFNFIGIEREAEYVAIAEARIGEAQKRMFNG
jgi:DNA modification methylase